MSTGSHESKKADIEFHEQTAHSYDEVITKAYAIYHSYSLHPFLDSIRIPGTPMKVLDMGCGTGAVTLALAARGFEVTAIDHSPDMIEIARRKAEALGLSSSIRFETGDVEQLRYDDEEFDGVTCQGLLHHLEDMSPALSQLHRVLKREGFVYISEPCDDLTIVGKAAARSVTAIMTAIRCIRIGTGYFKRSHSDKAEPGKAPDEGPVSSKELLGILDELGLAYEVEYMTHLPFLDRFLPDSFRLALARIISFPWRKTKGDIIFAYGKKS